MIGKMKLTEYEVVISMASWRGTNRVSGEEWQGASWKKMFMDGTLFHSVGLDLEYVWEQGRVRAANTGEGDGAEGVTVNLIGTSVKLNTHGNDWKIVDLNAFCWAGNPNKMEGVAVSLIVPSVKLNPTGVIVDEFSVC